MEAVAADVRVLLHRTMGCMGRELCALAFKAMELSRHSRQSRQSLRFLTSPIAE